MHMLIMILYLELELLVKGGAARGQDMEGILRGETNSADYYRPNNQNLQLVYK